MHNSFFKRIKPLFVLCILFCLSANAQQFKNEDELKKEASRLFDEDEFTKAYNLYAQLVSNYPSDPELNYRLGVCMLYSEPDKKKCYSYLNLAANHPKDAPKDAKFYLAKAYHMNYKFDEAIKLYNQYKAIGSASQIKKLQVDREITACKNGKRLLASMTELVVISKKQLNESDYFRSYDLSNVGGKLLVKPDDFKTGYDKRKKDKSVVYIPKSGEKIYFSSYGDNGDNGRDIYMAIRMANGTFAKAQPVPGINTEFDEDYPFLHPNGRTLYFSSKGYNSMGGYDVFKSTYDETTNKWSAPVNMEFPINSPDDDYLFVTDLDEKIAYFSTGRQSPPGKIDVLKINTERRPMELAVLKGTVLKESAEQSLKAKITVKNMEDGSIVGTYNSQDNGDYYMEIPNGGKFIFTVETPGLPTQSDKVSLPMAMTMRPFKQSISYNNKILQIKNYFDSPPDEEDYLRYLEMIERKAKLDVNEDKVKTAPIPSVAANTATEAAVATNNPTPNSTERVETDNQTKTNPNTNTNPNSVKTPTAAAKEGVTNKQLVDIAKKDAGEAKAEAAKMNQDAADAFEIANAKKIEADDLQKKADEAMAGATAITGDEVKKNEAVEKATAIQQEATNATNVANTIMNLAKGLDADAKAKQSEAILNEQYANELEKVSATKNNKESLAKLDELQKQIAETSKQKNKSDDLYNSIKSEYDQKQAQIAKVDAKSDKLKNDIEEVKKEINLTDSELAKTKDKSLKENLNAQNTELKAELDSKNKDLAQNEQLSAKLKAEAVSLQSEIDLTNKIKTSDFATAVAVNTNTSSASNPTNTKAITGTYESVNNDYSKQLSAVSNPTEKTGIAESNKILNDYTKKLNDLIAIDKADLKNTTKPEEKKKINDELKQLEAQKTSNQKQIADNNTKLKQLESTAIAANSNPVKTNTTAVTETKEPVNTATTAIAVKENNNPANTTATTAAVVNNTNASEKPEFVTNAIFTGGTDDLNKLNALKNGISNESNPSFSFKDYKEQSSLTLRTDADLKLQNANATKEALGNTIAKAEEEIKNAPPVANANNPQALDQEAEVYAKKATSLRIEAASYQGADKERMLKEVKEFEKQAGDKHLEAADLVKNTNKNIYDVNSQNIDDLLTINKSAKPDMDEARKLDNEAKQNFKQARSIREEADAQASAAAKLGTISNAEEKEAEAIAKQKKAVELLMKANSGFALKEPANANATPEATKEALAKVTSQFDKLNQEKIDAYMALSKANQNEIKLQGAKINAKPAIKNNTNKEAAAYKKQADAVNKEAVGLISKAISEPNAALKQSLLANANKKEVEAIAALNNASALLDGKTVEPIASNPSTSSGQVEPKTNEPKTTNEPIANNPSTSSGQAEPKNNAGNQIKSTETKTTSSEPVANNPSTSSGQAEPKNNAGNEIKSTETKTTTSEPLANNPSTSSGQAEPKNNAGNEIKSTETKTTSSEPVANNPSTSSGQAEPKNNAGNQIKSTETKTTSGEPVANNTQPSNPNAYKSVEADKMRTDAVTALKTIEEEKAKVEAEIKNTPPTETPAAELVKTITKQNTIADSISKQARTVRAEAATKQGPEKDTLIAKAKDLETKAAVVKVSAAETQAALNDATYKTYNNAIAQMMSEVQGKPEYEQVQSLASEAAATKKQAEEIRKESAAQPSAQAKLGGYNNAEEKELELLMKQEQAISLLKKYSPGYVVPEPKIVSTNVSPELKTKLDDLNQKQVAELEKQNTAYVMEQEAAAKVLPKTLNPAQKAVKANSDNLIVQAKSLITKASQTTDPVQKKELLAQATKKGEESIAEINKVAETKAGTAVASNTPKNNTTKNNQTNKEPKTTEPKTSNKEPKTTEPKTSEPVATNPSTSSGQVEPKTSNAEPKTTEPKTSNKEPKIKEPKTSEPVASNPSTSSGQVEPKTSNAEPKTNEPKTSNKEPKIKEPKTSEPIASKEPKTTQPKTSNAEPKTNEPKTTEPKNYNPEPNSVAIKVEGLEIKTTNAYSASNPIPVDQKMPEGLVFRVQIGAFKTKINDAEFKGLEPVNAQTTPNGYIRYTAGNFTKFEIANGVKNDLRNLGYKDAFVVGYYDGQRITVGEALAILEKNGTPANLANAPTTAGIGSNVNVPKNPVLVANNPNTSEATDPAVVVKDLNQINGLLYTVQIGLFSRPINKYQVYNLTPIYSEHLPNGLYRYTAGIYNLEGRVKEDQGKVNALGIKDAFASSYLNGKRIPFMQGVQIQKDSANIKMEAENPIVFGNNSNLPPIPASNNPKLPATENTANPTPAPNTPTVAPFSNNVTSAPAPTPENGVKADEAGISFKVQIGAYRNQVPNETAAKFLNIKTWPIANKVVGGLYLYTIGNFVDAKSANKLKEEAKSVGISDAFITVYKDGQKLYGNEANSYLGK